MRVYKGDYVYMIVYGCLWVIMSVYWYWWVSIPPACARTWRSTLRGDGAASFSLSKSMRRYEYPLLFIGIMGIYIYICMSINACGCLWMFMSIYRWLNVCKCMYVWLEVYGYGLWVFMIISKCYGYLGVYECLLVFMGIYACLCVFLDIYRFLGVYAQLWVFIWVIMGIWLSMGVYGSSWVFMSILSIYGCQWLFITVSKYCMGA